MLYDPLTFTYIVGSPWFPANVNWSAVDDRVRGGSSQSYLSAIENTTNVCFSGHLDTKTLGGAGFASQSTLEKDEDVRREPESLTSEKSEGLHWDLSMYDGLELEVGVADKKLYTFIVKDEIPKEKRNDGRMQAGISWEYDFRVGEKEVEGASGEEQGNSGENGVKRASSDATHGTKIRVSWKDFRPTYRGREKKDAEPLKTGEIKRFSIMMRR